MTDATELTGPQKGSLGSVFWQMRAPPHAVGWLASEADWNRLGKRVLIDPIEGLISWMSPSRAHESFARAADKVVDRAGERLGLRVKALGGGRWRQRPDDPPNTGMEADASFYIGPKADQWLEAFESGGRTAAAAFEERTPPDLVVEIEWTNADRKKPSRYAELGVHEMWRVQGDDESDGIAAEIIDLLAKGGPRPVEESALFRGLANRELTGLLDLAHRTRYREMELRLAELLSGKELELGLE